MVPILHVIPLVFVTTISIEFYKKAFIVVIVFYTVVCAGFLVLLWPTDRLVGRRGELSLQTIFGRLMFVGNALSAFWVAFTAWYFVSYVSLSQVIVV
jgi:hypothetical protein